MPLWLMVKRNALFLDVHAANLDEGLRAEISSWGCNNGYVEPRTLWRAWFTDESGEWRYMLRASEKEALDEVLDQGIEEGPDGKPAVEAVEVLAATSLLCDRVSINSLSDRDSFDFVAMVWAEETQPLLDGVWWREEYSPANLSAPRGGIFPQRISQWTVVKSELNNYVDDESESNLRPGAIPMDTGFLETPLPVASA